MLTFWSQLLEIAVKSFFEIVQVGESKCVPEIEGSSPLLKN